MAEWGKLYGTLHSSEKWRRATKNARALWTTANSWCIDHEKPGDIPAHMLKSLDGTPAEAACLVACGLWETRTDGWAFHAWEERQDLQDDVVRRRQANAERKRRSRASHTDVTRDGHTDVTRDTSVTKRDGHGARGEKRREEKIETPNGVSTAAVAAEAFDEFWTAYPRRDDKGHAVKAFTAAMRKTDAETIIDGARKFATTCERERRERKFIPLAATWLNGERWGDEPGGATSRGEQPSRQEFNITDLRLAGLLPPDPPHTHRPDGYKPVVVPDDA